MTVINASATYTSGSSGWDLMAATPAPPDEVNLLAQNDNSCAHTDSIVDWVVKFEIDDPHGLTESALDDGCVEINTETAVQFGYSIGEECFTYACGTSEVNELGIRTSSDDAHYRFTFVNPANPSDITVIPSNRHWGNLVHLWYQYKLAIPQGQIWCELETAGLTVNNDSILQDATSASGRLFTCKRLKYYEITNVQYYFEKKSGAPDLATTEAISKGEDYSFKLLNIEYDWCD